MKTWPRLLEVLLALWLLATPLAFGPAGKLGAPLDVLCGLVVGGLALTSLGTLGLRRSRLASLLPAGLLVLHGWMHAPAPAAQSELVIGLLLAMIGVLPTDALEPPQAWLDLAPPSAGGARALPPSRGERALAASTRARARELDSTAWRS